MDNCLPNNSMKKKAPKNSEATASPYFPSSKGSCHMDGQLTLNMLSQAIPNRRLGYNFFNQDCITLAKALLGQRLIHCVDGRRSSGFIIETECYLGVEDGASHSYKGKRTNRTEPMFMKPGTSYVYSIYGMYHCFNISSRGAGAAVLIRALEPCEDIDAMDVRRQIRRKSGKKLKPSQLANGPSKLCQALSINKNNCNKLDMTRSKTFWVEEGPHVTDGSIVISKRIGIEPHGPEWAEKPLRFYVLSNPNVSVRDKVAEGSILNQPASSGT